MREIARTQVIITTNPNELPLVPVKVNSSGPYNFILDTGASCCCLATELAKDLRIKKRAKGIDSATAANGKFSATSGKISTISIGRAVRKNIDVTIFDFHALGKIDKTIVGIIGYSFLCQYIVTIDYKQNELILCKP